MEKKAKRNSFTGSIGFVLAAAGSAVSIMEAVLFLKSLGIGI